jgi:hypothetical protein
METEGLLESFDVLGAFVHLWKRKFTGALRFERESLIKIFYFHDGVIVAATSNDPPDTVGEILRRSGKISDDQLRQLSEGTSARSVGEALVSSGFITRKELLWALKMQLIEMINSILRWSDGSYSLVENYLPKRTDNVSFLTQHVLLELILRTTDRGIVVGRIIGADDVLSKVPDTEDEYRALDLSKDADAIVSRLDGAATVAEIGASAKIDDFSVFKLLGALKLLGILSDLRQTAAPAAIPAEPVGIDFGAPVELGGEPALPLETPQPAPLGLSIEPPVALPAVLPPAVSFSVEPEIPSPSVSAAPLPPVPEAEPAAIEFPAPTRMSFELEMEAPPPAAEGGFSRPSSSPPIPIGSEAGSFKSAEELDGGRRPAPPLSLDFEEGPSMANAAIPSPALTDLPARTDDLPSLEAQLGETFEDSPASASAGPTQRIQGKRVTVGFRGEAEDTIRAKAVRRWSLIGAALLVVGVAVGAWFWKRSHAIPDEDLGPAVPASVRPVPRPSVPATPSSPAESAAPTSASPLPGTVASSLVAVPAGTAAAAPTVAASPAVPPPASPAPKPAPVVASATPVKPAPPVPVKPAVAPPPAAGGSAEYGAMAKSFAKQAAALPAGQWTLKIDSVCSDESIARALAASTAEAKVWFVPVEVSGKTCYRLFTGFYSSQQAAEAAISRIPATLREGSKPTPMPIAKAIR